jgi:tetratricopeptide (TPR) repeat protein
MSLRNILAIILLFLAPAFTFAGQGEGALSKGKGYLAEGDFLLAEEQFDLAVKAEPRLNEEVGSLWFEEGVRKISKGEFDSAAAIFSKAVYFNGDLAPRAGEALLKAGAEVSAENQRMRLAHRAIPLSGAAAVLASSLDWYEKRLGPAKKVVIENPGWVTLGEVGAGGALRYLSEFPFLERNGDTMRIMPEAVERVMELRFDSAPSELMVSRQKEPATVYLWIIPAEKPATNGEMVK